MKISTKGRYALRIMLDLATADQDQPVRVKEIAKRQNISIKYLEQIITVLAKAGYLKSNRGPQGGYRLARPPKEYTVGMILRLTEGSLAPVPCLEDETNNCPRQDYCVTLRIWKEIYAAIQEVVDRYTLEDLVQWQSNVVDLACDSYVI